MAPHFAYWSSRIHNVFVTINRIRRHAQRLLAKLLQKNDTITHDLQKVLLYVKTTMRKFGAGELRRRGRLR
jgi:hypothetical protein